MALGANVPNLRSFMLKRQVLKLYRQFLCCAREASIPMSARAEIISEVRRAFEMHKGVADPKAIRHLVSEGHVRLKELRSHLSIASDGSG